MRKGRHLIAVVDYKMGNLLSVERGVRVALENAKRTNVRYTEDVRITSDADEIARASAIILPGVGAFADAETSMCKLGQKDVIAQQIRDGVPFLGICLGLHLLCDFGVEGAGSGCANEVGDISEMAESSNECKQPVSGMGFISETVNRLPSHDEQGNFYKVPHVGWNTVEPCALAGVRAGVQADGCLREQMSESVSGKQGDQPRNHSTEQMSANTAVQQGEQSCEQKSANINAQQGEQSCEQLLEQTFDNPLFDGINPGFFFYFTHSYFVPVCEQTIATTTHSVVFSSAVQFAPRAFGVQFHPEKSSDAGAKLLENFVKIALAE